MEQSYKEKYEQAIERLKQWDREHPCGGFVLSDRDKFIFPELAESEDEKVIKEIIELVMQPTWKTEEEFHRRNVLCAWLENIPYTIDHEKREGFHLGYKAGLERLEMKSAEESLGIDSDTYNKIVDECIFGEQNLAENAKPQSSTPMSYGKELEKRMCEACDRFFAPNTDSNRYSASDLFYAGVKAERDLNTLTWSEEDVRVIDDIFYSINEESVTEGLNDRGIMYALKDIRGIVRYLRNWLQDLKRRVQPQPKQGLREEEEAVLDALIRRLKGEDIYVSPHLAVECLESIKGRVLSQPKQKWSEEDEEILRTILSDGIRGAELDMLQVNWLKSLRPQNRWKPSDEHIRFLQAIVNDPNNASSESCQIVLKDILEQLKKLKEG